MIGTRKFLWIYSKILYFSKIKESWSYLVFVKKIHACCGNDALWQKSRSLSSSCPSRRRPLLLIVAACTPLVHISLPSHFILACMLVPCFLYPSASRPPPPMPSHVLLRFPVLPDARQASFSSYGSHFSCSSYSFRSFCCSRLCFVVHSSLNLKAFNKYLL